VDSKILATVCARSGSKGVPGKNTRPLDGKPLILHTIDLAKRLGIFEDIVVSTDSEEIRKLAIDSGVKAPFRRPDELATDTAPKIPGVVRHCLISSEEIFQKRYDVIVDLDPTSPLRSVDDVMNALNLFNESGCPNLISGMRSRKSPYFNLLEYDRGGEIRLSKTLKEIPSCRQLSPKCFDMNASIYIWTRKTLLEENGIFLRGTKLFLMPPERSIDVDDEIDFEFVEYLIRKRKSDG
jgi:CMP-N,N'-diacetyllegionaminic acid synthase